MLCSQDLPLDGLQNLTLSSLYEILDYHNQSVSNLSSIISAKLQASPTTTSLAALTIQTAGYHISGHIIDHSNDTNSTLSSSLVSNPSSSTQTVSWQSAFWAIAAIAINSCLQDCGKICEFKKELSMLIRASPIFCALDSLIILFQLLYYTFTQGPRQAFKIVASSRDQHSESAENEAARPVQYVMRLLLMLIAALQAVKLYALRGIPWTQGFGGCFLASYMLNALLNVFGQPPPALELAQSPLLRRGDIIPRMKTVQVLNWIAFIAQFALWAILARPTLSAVLLTWSTPCLVILHLVGLAPYALVVYPLWGAVIIVLTIPWIGALLVELSINVVPVAIILLFLTFPGEANARNAARLISTLLDVKTTTVVVFTGIVLLTAGIFIRTCFWSWSAIVAFARITSYEEIFSRCAELPVEVGEIYDPYGLIVTMILLALSFSYLVARCLLFGPLSDKLQLRQLSVANNAGWACLNLFLGNLAFALLYYTMVYTPENTWKPNWTENLGKLLL